MNMNMNMNMNMSWFLPRRLYTRYDLTAAAVAALLHCPPRPLRAPPLLILLLLLSPPPSLHPVSLHPVSLHSHLSTTSAGKGAFGAAYAVTLSDKRQHEALCAHEAETHAESFSSLPASRDQDPVAKTRGVEDRVA